MLRFKRNIPTRYITQHFIRYSSTVNSESIPPPPKKRLPHRQVLSGIQPTGDVHIGNYYGALTNWVTMQENEPYMNTLNVLENISAQRKYIQDYGHITQTTSTGKLVEPYKLTIPSLDPHKVLYSIVDLHALTVPQIPKELQTSSLSLAATILAVGVDPKKAGLFLQSHVSGHSELSWLLTCNTPISWLYRMTQFKDKSQKLQDKENANGNGNEELLRGVSAGLLSYPVLMAADILLYNASHVPVGADQTQHLELTREIARTMNHLFAKKSSPLFVEPSCIYNTEAARVMSLRTPTSKMSKSDPSEQSRISLTDTDAQIRKKIQTAVTDSLGAITYDKERHGVMNLLEILAATKNSQVQRDFFRTMENDINNTMLVKEGYLNNPDYLYSLAAQGLSENALSSPIMDAPHNATFDTIVNEYISVVKKYQAGPSKVTPATLAEEYSTFNLSSLKDVIGTELVKELGPIRETTKEYLTNKQHLEDVLHEGSEFANKKANSTMERVRSAMGLVSKRM